jgi:hypothetical protein
MLASGVVLGSAIDEAVIVRLVTVATTVALSVVLFAGCSGGGDDHAKVEGGMLRGPKPKRYRRNLCKPVPTTRTGSSTC